MLILSIFSVIWILINFFYVEKLTSLGISEEWISGIILGYSLIEMLAEPIVSWGEKVVKTRLFTVFCALSLVWQSLCLESCKTRLSALL